MGYILKKRKIAIFILFIIVILVIIFVHLGEQSDNTIKEKAKEIFLSEYSAIKFEKIDVEITDKETGLNKDSYYTILNICGTNDEIELECVYRLKYKKCDINWQLEHYKCTDINYEMKKSLLTKNNAVTDLNEHFPKQYEDVQVKDRITDLSNKEDTFILNAKYKKGYLERMDEITISYNYDLFKGWVATISVDEGSNDWLILGKWTYQATGGDMWINIDSVKDNVIYFEYKFNFKNIYEDLNNEIINENKSYSSTKLESRNIILEEDNDTFSFQLVEGEANANYVYVSAYGGITFQNTYIEPSDSYVFYYEDGDGYDTRIENKIWLDKINLSKLHVSNCTKYIDGCEHSIFEYESEDSGYASNTYNIYGQYNTLVGEVSLNNRTTKECTGKINIIGDGKELYSVEVKDIIGKTEKTQIQINISGVKELTIECGGGRVLSVLKIGPAYRENIYFPTITLSNVEIRK